MKRANLHSIIFYTMVIMTVLIVPLYGQKEQQGSYVFQNFTLSDFGDGYDAAKSLVWQPKFSDFVTQVPTDDAVAEEAVGDNELVMLGGDTDPARNGIRYTLNKPRGITELVGGSQKYVLGVKAQFTQQGYNWIELHPALIGEGAEDPAVVDPAVAGDPAADPQAQATANAETFLLATAGEVENAPDVEAEATPFKIPFSGKATEISMWVWGGYYGWWVEVYLKDYLGYQYRIPMGDLLYKGWRQKRTGIPSSILQTRERLPATQTLTFEMIKLWSFPSERVDQFYVYFDLLQHNAIVSTEVFNGKSLESELW